ncbi:hypothetical protein QYE76_023106 [Lolium multiflorum]|uniref:Integrase catalytic domain-containing protein n=1 Tax=Lolium multiflorum TaxID=4521 RepID=A0AAD8RCP0_LOLMU|nr:hypothetical protein QYE76_023106 [Lolium multiflorum]
MKPPTTKKELQCLIGKINFVRRFISNPSGRIEPFMGLVKIKPDEEFRWGAEQQQAFDDIKEYLTKPPVLVPPRQDMPFYIYLSVADTSIASVVVQVYDGLGKWFSTSVEGCWTQKQEVWEHSDGACISNESHHQALAIPRWGMDMIGEIHPSSSKGHRWVLAITDYFTKWVEAVPMKKVASEDVIKFVLEHVIHRFGIPQTITTDGGSVFFVSKEMKKFCDDMGIKLIRSSPYYAQANGQAEASNKSLIKLIKRKIDEHPKRWHEVLSEALWAYRMSCHGAIKTTPYQLVYGQEAVLPGSQGRIKAGHVS